MLYRDSGAKLNLSQTTSGSKKLLKLKCHYHWDKNMSYTYLHKNPQKILKIVNMKQIE